MSNKIQIKRSVANSVVTGLANGELAYTQNSNILYIGAPDGSGSIAIGGQRFPGTLTANQALVADSSSAIDKVIVANLVPTQVFANGSVGTSGYLLASGAAGNAYWLNPTTLSTNPAGSNTQIQFNNSGSFGASGGLTFDITSNTLTSSNAVSTAYITATNGSRNLTFNYNSISGAVGVSTDLNVGVSGSGGNVVSNGYFVGNGYYVTSVNAALLNGNSASDLRTYTDNKAANAYSNAMADTLSRNGIYTGNNQFDGANLVIAGTNTYISSNLTLAGANLSISSNVLLTGSSLTGTSTDLSVRNATISGNLTVTGTVTTINVATIVVNDNIIELADNNNTSDLVDTGWFAPAGNATSIWYSGVARIAGWSANNDAVMRVFASNTNPNTASTIDPTGNTSTGTMVAYLAPYATSSALGGAFSVNSTAIAITANATVSASIVANSLHLSTALAAIYGGTGLSSYTTGDLLYASNTTYLSSLSVPGSAANGQVLQIVNNLPAYGTLDGGTF